MRSKRLKLAFTVAGTMIGAGFATGKELLLFFGNTSFSLVSLFLAVSLIGAVSLLYFEKQKKSDVFCNKSLTNLLFYLFSGASCTVMFACGGEALWEVTGLPFPLGTVLTGALTVGTVFFGLQNVYRFNMIATPILLICMIGISLAGLLSPAGLFGVSSSGSVNILLYSGYNLLSVLPVLGALSDSTDEKDGCFGIVLGFSLVLTTGLLMKAVLIRFASLSQNSAIPVLTVVSHLHGNLSFLYTVMLYLSVLTTAVNSFYAITKGKKTIAAGLFLLGCSFFGFSTLIELLYPLFGYLGIGVTIAIIFKGFIKPNRKDVSNGK